MKSFLSKLLGRAGDLADVQPLLALFLGAALLAVFLTSTFVRASKTTSPQSLVWTLYHQMSRLLWAALLVLFLVGALSVLRTYLRQTVANFQRSHGRVTEANYNAVQTIWGAEQTQGELRMNIYYDEEITERIESEDITKPAVLRKKTVRRFITDNPFVTTRHDVTLRQNPRKKGSALYGGYETDCRLQWKLKNPSAQPGLKTDLVFPLPAAGAMYDELSATLNGEDVLPQMQIKDAALVLARDLKPDEELDFRITFKSRGMSFWYFQVRETREIRDFTLTMNLPDLAKPRLNYPEGCMTPTEIKPTADEKGSVLTYRLDHAISGKGMGIALPNLPQPGATTNAVLGEAERGWMLIFAMLVLGLTLAAVNHAVIISSLFGAATAFGFGLLGDFSDLLFGFWGTAALILLPMFAILAWLLTQTAPGTVGKLLAFQLLLFGIIYPALAGLDGQRQSLYLNLCALILLTFTARQVMKYLSTEAQPQS